MGDSRGSGLSFPPDPSSPAQACLSSSPWLGLRDLPRVGSWVCPGVPGLSHLPGLSPGTYPCAVE